MCSTHRYISTSWCKNIKRYFKWHAEPSNLLILIQNIWAFYGNAILEWTSCLNFIASSDVDAFIFIRFIAINRNPIRLFLFVSTLFDNIDLVLCLKHKINSYRLDYRLILTVIHSCCFASKHESDTLFQ